MNIMGPIGTLSLRPPFRSFKVTLVEIVVDQV